MAKVNQPQPFKLDNQTRQALQGRFPGLLDYLDREAVVIRQLYERTGGGVDLLEGVTISDASFSGGNTASVAALSAKVNALQRELSALLSRQPEKRPDDALKLAVVKIAK